MGYTTEFEGTLKFEKELTIEQLKTLNGFLSLNPDEVPELQPFYAKGERYSYLQYEVTKAMDGLKWDGNEKFYYSVEALNLILRYMRSKFPEFNLTGALQAQGEEISDRWELHMKDGTAVRVETPPAGTKIECPECDHEFYYQG